VTSTTVDERWGREARALQAALASRQDEPKETETPTEGEDSRNPGSRLLWDLFDKLGDNLFYIVVSSVYALVKAMGLTVDSGYTGLRFTFGRAGARLEPGFHWMIPFVQKGEILPTRSRTLDLPSQRVATLEGLVLHADANLVYRIVDIRRALIEIDDVVKGMVQMLGLGVQEVLRTSTRVSIHDIPSLNEQLKANLTRRLAPWGVSVEAAGFPSITPSPQSLRITQMDKVTQERMRALGVVESGDVLRAMALGLVGTRQMPRRRAIVIQSFERHRRRLRRLRAALTQKGWSSVRIRRAELALMSRVSTSGRLRSVTR
tara:strand:+ start:2706 stop:3659 length:954 start_codon:yes stop_codon:yes gene_type:complete